MSDNLDIPETELETGEDQVEAREETDVEIIDVVGRQRSEIVDVEANEVDSASDRLFNIVSLIKPPPRPPKPPVKHHNNHGSSKPQNQPGEQINFKKILIHPNVFYARYPIRWLPASYYNIRVCR